MYMVNLSIDSPRASTRCFVHMMCTYITQVDTLLLIGLCSSYAFARASSTNLSVNSPS